MYHYNPETALEELTDETILPNPVHVRDMMIRTRLSPEHAVELNRQFQEYLQLFGSAQKLVRSILDVLVEDAKRGSRPA